MMRKSIHVMREILSADRLVLSDSPPRPLAWVSAFTPVEILVAARISVFYPESHAAILATRDLAPDLLAASDSDGIAQDLCSYYRVFHGALQRPDLHSSHIPAPDLLVAAKNQCGTIPLWWSLLHRAYPHVPLVVIDFPFVRSDETEPEQACKNGYVARQLRELASVIQARLSLQVNESRLAEAVNHSAQTCAAWRRFLELRRSRRFGVTPHRAIEVMLPVVTHRPSPLAAEYFTLLREEIVAKASADEKSCKRVLWFGYPYWFMAQKYPGFEHHAHIVTDDYCDWWALAYGEGDPWESLATAYRRTFLNQDGILKARWLEQHVREYAIDGVVFALNRSCKRDAGDHTIVRAAAARLGLPSTEIEADMIDAGHYDREGIALRLAVLGEMLKR